MKALNNSAGVYVEKSVLFKMRNSSKQVGYLKNCSKFKGNFVSMTSHVNKVRYLLLNSPRRRKM